MKLDELQQNAFILENRGYYDEASPYYQELFKRVEALDLPVLERMARFFTKTDNLQKGFMTAKSAIKLGGSLSVFLPIFFKGFPHYETDPLLALDWLMTQPGIRKSAEAMLSISKEFRKLGQMDKSYFTGLKSVSLSEKLLRDSDDFAALFNESILNLIELEYEFKELVQARYQLKKLIGLHPHLLVRKVEVARWSAILDLFPDLYKCESWETVRSTLVGDMEIIGSFYDALFRKANPAYVYEKLAAYRFEDDYFSNKKPVYMAILAKGLGKPVSLEQLESSANLIPMDLLSALFYYDQLNLLDREKAGIFLEEKYKMHRDRREMLQRLRRLSVPSSAKKDLMEDVSVTFFGGGEKIGGTSILVKAGDSSILLDAGIHLHSESFIPDYTPLDHMGLALEDLDALLITHAHLDHTGAVPYIKKHCPDLRLFATAPTAALMKVLLQDTVKRAGGNDLEAELNDEADLNQAIHSIEPVSFNRTFVVPSKRGRDWKVTYYQAGHILGAGAVYLDNGEVRILFTGDFSLADQKTVPGLKLPKDLEVDVLITESTYGFLPMESSESRDRQERLLMETIENALRNDGNILIPAFSLGRAQEVILLIKDMYKGEVFLPFDVYLDGKVVEICRIYQRFAESGQYFNQDSLGSREPADLFLGNGVRSAKEIYWRNSRFSESPFDDFYEDYISTGGNCIISSSGMLLDHSASARYAEKMIDQALNAIVFTGYLDEESPGFKIRKVMEQPETPSITINGKEKKLEAQIDSVRLSAHASREDIAELIVRLQPSRVFLMHGEHQNRYRPVKSRLKGEEIYPSIIELLNGLDEDIAITPAFNGETYSLKI